MQVDFPIVKVTWADAQEAGVGWLDLQECIEAPLAKCYSVGWLAYNDDKKIVIMATLARNDADSEITQGGDCTAIPADWVTDIEYL